MSSSHLPHIFLSLSQPPSPSTRVWTPTWTGPLGPVSSSTRSTSTSGTREPCDSLRVLTQAGRRQIFWRACQILHDVHWRVLKKSSVYSCHCVKVLTPRHLCESPPFVWDDALMEGQNSPQSNESPGGNWPSSALNLHKQSNSGPKLPMRSFHMDGHRVETCGNVLLQFWHRALLTRKQREINFLILPSAKNVFMKYVCSTLLCIWQIFKFILDQKYQVQTNSSWFTG